MTSLFVIKNTSYYLLSFKRYSCYFAFSSVSRCFLLPKYHAKPHKPREINPIPFKFKISALFPNVGNVPLVDTFWVGLFALVTIDTLLIADKPFSLAVVTPCVSVAWSIAVLA